MKESAGPLPEPPYSGKSSVIGVRGGPGNAALRIVPFDRIGVGLAFRNRIAPEVIPEPLIRIEGIAVIVLGLHPCIDQVLQPGLAAFPHYPTAQETAGGPIDQGQDVDRLFFSPTKVNSSSISASWILSGTGGGKAVGLGLDPQRDGAMMHPQLTRDPAQVQSIHIQRNRLSADFLVIRPGFRLGGIFDLAKQASIALASPTGLACSVLAFRTIAFGTIGHDPIIAQLLATPQVSSSTQYSIRVVY